jgi:hypothetical protein
MGFFSWKTMDTDKSISNAYSNRGTFRVQMVDDKGNVWTEDNYEGYGVFGGKDYYELLAEMNGEYVDKEFRDTITDEQYTNMMRMEGINMAFKDNGSGEHTFGVKYPNLVEMADGWNYQHWGPESCDDQGYFYADDSFEETDWDEFEDEENEF